MDPLRNRSGSRIAPKKVLSGSQKLKKKMLLKEQMQKDALNAANFFKKPSELGGRRNVNNEAGENDTPTVETQPAVVSPPSAEENTFDASDPSTWDFPLTSSQKQLLLDEPPRQTLLKSYPKIGKTGFNSKNYHCQFDGQPRDWLLYSKTSNSLYCFSCCLFAVSSRSSHSSWKNYGKDCHGFQDYVHQSRGIKLHEQSEHHYQSTISWKKYVLMSKSGRLIDSALQEEMAKEVSFWKQVLRALIDAILYLAKNNLAFQGKRKGLGEHGNGNFLSLVELLSKYHPPLAIHINRIQHNVTKTTYLSADIQNEFIGLASDTVRKEIITSIKDRKYFSIMFDSTPDVANMEQISQVIRTVSVSAEGCKIEEHFLGFVQMDKKTGADIADAILEKLASDGLDMKFCRGQGYDNGANMSGKYKGVQARIREKYPLAVFIPCAAHSLNLVGQNAASKVLAGKLLLGQIQNLYNFFSGSSFRWKKLKEHVQITLKSQSTTRWSSKFAAVSAVTNQFEKIVEALNYMIESEETNAHTFSEASALVGQMYTFRFLLGSIIWKLILERINVCNELLQKEGISVDKAGKHLTGLIVAGRVSDGWISNCL